jgi:hypothetical protein
LSFRNAFGKLPIEVLKENSKVKKAYYTVHWPL